METKTRAIVLRSVRYGDSQIIVDVFSREKGRASFICHVSKNGRGKIRQQLFQPLTILEIVYDDRPTRSLQRFRDIRLAQPYFSIPFQPEKLAIGLFIAEFLSYALRDEQCNEPLYDYVESSVTWLDNVVGQFANFHLVFMLRLSRFIGFFPNLEEMAEGDWFDLRNGVFTPIKPLHPDYLRPEDAAKIGEDELRQYEVFPHEQCREKRVRRHDSDLLSAAYPRLPGDEIAASAQRAILTFVVSQGL